MNTMRLVSLNLPVEVIAAIGQAARDAGQPPQDLVRAALYHIFIGDAAPAAEPPQSGVRQSGALEAGSAAQPPDAVQPAFAGALGWLDLQSRLRAAGFMLRLGADGVLALHTWPADHRLIDAAAIGQPLEKLTLRFRAAFPGQVLPERFAPEPATPRRFPPAPARRGRAA